MLNRNYQKSLAIGCVSAGGALGILIPPSNIMILYGSLVGVSVGKLFMGGVFPGLLLAAIFCAYIAIRSFLDPKLCPALPKEERVDWRTKIKTLRAVILPMFLILLVLGVIFAGVSTPTEAAAVGGGGSVLCAAVYRKLNWPMFKEASYRSIRLTAMIMWIVFGAKIFTAVYTALGAPSLMQNLIAQIGANRWVVMAVMQLTFFFLGMIIDPVGIVSICAPVFVPVAVSLGFDPVWYGVLFVINMEMAYITPPFGFNLFYMKGVVPKGISMGDIYRSVWPYVGLQALCLILVIIFPQIALWLVGKMVGQ
jgi:tripartite ATP-independent transporter DctM subunit